MAFGTTKSPFKKKLTDEEKLQSVAPPKEEVKTNTEQSQTPNKNINNNPLTAPINQGSLNFRPNGRVQAIDTQGNTYDFSPQEYKATLGNTAGGVNTPQVQAFLENQRKTTLQGQELRGIAETNVRTQALQDATGNQQAVAEQLPSLGTINADLKNRQADATFQEVKNLTPIQMANKVTTEGAKKSLSFAVQLFQGISTAVQSKKSVSVQQAETTFNDASGAIERDIANVDLGIINPTEARQNIERALVAIQSLEAQTRGLGKVDLRFWLDTGKELEASIANEKAVLQSQLNKLNLKTQQRAIAEARANYGL